MPGDDHVLDRAVPRPGLLARSRQPLPPAAWPRPLRWLPHTLIVLAAVLLSLTGADDTARILATVHAATLVVGIRRPVPAWVLSTALTTGIVLGHPPTPANAFWAWTVQAGTVLLVTLRNPLPLAAGAAVLSGLLAAGLHRAGAELGDPAAAGYAAAACAAAVVAGTAARSRRRAREQEAVAARERAHRMLLQERNRIARELHDVVAHHMSLIAVQADAAPHRVAGPPPDLVAAFGSIRGNALEALAELRRVLGVLRAEPEERPQPTLEQLDELLAQVRAAGLTVTAQVRGTRRALPASVHLSAYRIVQEALSNALRHAPGSAADVEIVHGDAALRIRVRNAPPARPVPPSPGAGHGLLGMRERAAMLGGELSAGPGPDGGYEVVALLPIPASPVPEEEHP